jgi:hypothetical protein
MVVITTILIHGNIPWMMIHVFVLPRNIERNPMFGNQRREVYSDFGND